MKARSNEGTFDDDQDEEFGHRLGVEAQNWGDITTNGDDAALFGGTAEIGVSFSFSSQGLSDPCSHNRAPFGSPCRTPCSPDRAPAN